VKQELSKEAVLKTNPRVDPGVVRQAAELRQQLERVGIRSRPHFRLLPPLGRAIRTSQPNATPAQHGNGTRRIGGSGN